MRFLALASVVFLAGVQMAQAGAWLREKGTGFAAGSGTLTQDDFYSGSAYAEYGLTDRLTLGLDATADMDPFGVITGDGTLFLRWPLGSVDGPSRWAMHVGAGARYQELMFFPSIEVGLSWGRGIKWGERYGWLAIDTSYNAAKEIEVPEIKLDATFGMGLSETTKVMAQVFMTQEGDFTAKFAPSLLYSPSWGPYTFQIGAEVPINYEDEIALKLGLWLEF